MRTPHGRTRDAVLLVLVLSTFGGRARATDRFVTPLGNDAANDCSVVATPCKSVARAVTQAASGDTVKVAIGTYPELVVIDTSTSLTLAGGWQTDFSALDSFGAKRTLITGQVQVTAQGTTVLAASFDRFTFADTADSTSVLVTARDTGSATVGFTNSIYAKNGGALGVVGSDSSTIDLSVGSSTFNRTHPYAAGAAFVSADGSSIVSAVFSDCTLSRSKGIVGIASSGTTNLTIVDSQFANNEGSSTTGGGAVQGSALSSGTLTIDIARCLFKANKVLDDKRKLSDHIGGALLLYSDFGGSLDATCTESTFIRNKAVRGGAIAIEGAGQVKVVNDVFVGNVAPKIGFVFPEGRGGALAIRSRGRNLVTDVVNSTFVSNKAYVAGGGIAVSAVGNSNTVNLTNEIFFRDRATGFGDDVSIEQPFGAVTVNADHSDFFDVVNDPMEPGIFNDLGGNIAADPLLNMRKFLTAGSPAIDSGTCTGAPATDFEGDPRPTGAGCDMGADEFVP